MTTSHLDRWLRVPRPRPHAALRLVCMPHAGGSAGAFRHWNNTLDAAIELVAVQYPGRLDRLGVPAAGGVPAMARAIRAELQDGDPRPLVLLGHSLGATVAYEVARHLDVPPVRLVASARSAPVAPATAVLHGLDDEHLVAALRRFGGTGAEVLDNAELRPLYLPAFRADLRAAETYVHPDGPALRCPVDAVVGTEDPVIGPDDVARWAEVAPCGFTLHTLPGDHFSLVAKPDGLLRIALSGLLGAPVSGVPTG